MSDVANAVPREARVILNANQPPDERWEGPLGKLLDDNAHDLDAEEVIEIVTTLGAGRVYVGGGGAAAEFTIELAR
jgi:hypothetical protein